MIAMILASLVGDIIALFFGSILVINKPKIAMAANYAPAFAAGALLAAAFIDLLPDAIEQTSPNDVFVAVLVGIVIFFLLERFIYWFSSKKSRKTLNAVAPLIIIGNILHRSIDGVAIAAGFLSSTKVGILVTISIVIHEIPHTISDFGLLVNKQIDRKKVIYINIAISLFTTLAAIIVYILGETFVLPIGILIGITVGFFIYIAVSDVIPDIHVQEDEKFIGLQSLIFIAGIVIVTILIELLHHFLW